MTEPSRILPRPTRVSEPYWQGCLDGELRMQFCTACQAYQFYPRVACSACGGSSLDWRRVSGNGRIASFTVVRRGVSSAYEAPYIVALIDLEEGPRLMSHVVAAEPDDSRLCVGAEVVVEFQEWGDEVAVPVFRLA